MIPPARDVDAAEFWSALEEGQLLVSVCGACGNRWLPPLATCPRCASREVTSAPSATTGALYSWTVIHMAADPAYAAETPYTVGLVELDDGARLYGRVVGVDHDALRDGLRLRVEIDTARGRPIWHFEREP
ncbi:MAG: Zn-ribbon domain-containing OB-fold protein [Acidimicrobiia bacterium]